eukprot:scaffold1883_cov108-Isochrysis_galbana.AAC.8
MPPVELPQDRWLGALLSRLGFRMALKPGHSLLELPVLEPRHSRFEPGHSRLGPRHSQLEPGHSRLEPRLSKFELRPSRLEPRHSRLEPRPASRPARGCAGERGAPSQSALAPAASAGRCARGLSHQEGGPRGAVVAPSEPSQLCERPPAEAVAARPIETSPGDTSRSDTSLVDPSLGDASRGRLKAEAARPYPVGGEGSGTEGGEPLAPAWESDSAPDASPGRARTPDLSVSEYQPPPVSRPTAISAC